MRDNDWYDEISIIISHIKERKERNISSNMLLSVQPTCVTATLSWLSGLYGWVILGLWVLKYHTSLAVVASTTPLSCGGCRWSHLALSFFLSFFLFLSSFKPHSAWILYFDLSRCQEKMSQSSTWYYWTWEKLRVDLNQRNQYETRIVTLSFFLWWQSSWLLHQRWI